MKFFFSHLCPTFPLPLSIFFNIFFLPFSSALLHFSVVSFFLWVCFSFSVCVSLSLAMSLSMLPLSLCLSFSGYVTVYATLIFVPVSLFLWLCLMSTSLYLCRDLCYPYLCPCDSLFPSPKRNCAQTRF